MSFIGKQLKNKNTLNTVESSNTPAPLELIAALESAGHTQRIHDLQTSGVHAGTRAVSSYGLMPVTLREVAGKHKPMKDSELGKQINKTADPLEINAITKDRKKDDELANHVWNYAQSRLQKNKPDLSKDQLELMSVFAHRRGINAALQEFNSGGIEGIKQDPYVKKYLDAKNKSASSPANQPKIQPRLSDKLRKIDTVASNI